MKNKRLYSIIALIIMGIVIFGLSPIYVKCDTNPIVVMSNLTDSEKILVEKTIDDINTELRDEELSEFLDYVDENNELTVVFDVSLYKNLDQKPRQKAMQIMLNGISNSKMSAMNRTKLYNFIANSDEPTSALVRQLNDDVRADYTRAYGIFAPWTGVIGTILGLLTLIIFICLTLTIVIDTAYLVIPVFNTFLRNPNPTHKPKVVSVEAWKAEQAVEENKNEMSGVMPIYLKLKFKQFIAIGLCLLYLVSGQIYDLIANIIDYFRGVLPK